MRVPLRTVATMVTFLPFTRTDPRFVVVDFHAVSFWFVVARSNLQGTFRAPDPEAPVRTVSGWAPLQAPE